MRQLEVRAEDRMVRLNPFLSGLFINLLTGFAASLREIDPGAVLRFERQGGKSRIFSCDREVPINPFVERLLDDLLLVLLKSMNAVEPHAKVIFIVLPDPASAP